MYRGPEPGRAEKNSIAPPAGQAIAEYTYYLARTVPVASPYRLLTSSRVPPNEMLETVVLDIK